MPVVPEPTDALPAATSHDAQNTVRAEHSNTSESIDPILAPAETLSASKSEAAPNDTDVGHAVNAIPKSEDAPNTRATPDNSAPTNEVQSNASAERSNASASIGPILAPADASPAPMSEDALGNSRADAVDARASTDSIAGWLEECKIAECIANALTKHKTNEGALRRVMDATTADIKQALDSELDYISQFITEAMKNLKEAEANMAKIKETNAKFQANALVFGTLEDHREHPSKYLGFPSHRVDLAIEHEHTTSADSMLEFKATNSEGFGSLYISCFCTALKFSTWVFQQMVKLRPAPS